jgi:hypothetical protein
MTIWGVALVIIYTVLFVKLFLRRRSTWSRRSWWRFALLFLLSLIPALGGLLLALRVDQGRQLGGTLAAHELSSLGLIAIAILAFCIPVYVLGWFTTGDSERQVNGL